MANSMGATPPTELLPMIDRFLAKVITSPKGCWVWTGTVRCKTRKYKQGVFSICKGVNIAAHHFAWLFYKGEIPAGKCLMHSCDNGLCVNPAHMRTGTNGENNKDRASKGRSAKGRKHGRYTKPESICKGSKNGTAKLTERDVKNIRFAYNCVMHPSISTLSKTYGVSISCISGIINRKTWRHI